MTIRSVLMALPLMFLGWLAVLLGVALITDEAPAYVVLFPSAGFLNSLPENTSLLATSSFSITLASEQENVARMLYNSGAWIVLPAGLTGCLPLPRTG